MGYYIPGPPKGKADYIIKEHGAAKLEKAPAWSEIPEGQAVICVVDNGPFEAAGFAYGQEELEHFASPDRGQGGFEIVTGNSIEELMKEIKKPTPVAPHQRPRTWLLMDRALAEKLSQYPNHR